MAGVAGRGLGGLSGLVQEALLRVLECGLVARSGQLVLTLAAMLVLLSLLAPLFATSVAASGVAALASRLRR